MAEKPQKRTYVVLNQDEAGYWSKVGTVTATSAEQAIRNAVGSEGVFVAIPARNFQPVKVSVEQPKPRIVLGAGKPETPADG